MKIISNVLKKLANLFGAMGSNETSRPQESEIKIAESQSPELSSDAKKEDVAGKRDNKTVRKAAEKAGVKKENKLDKKIVKSKRHKKSATKIDRETIALFRIMHPEMTVAQVANELKVSDATVYRAIADYGVNTEGKKRRNISEETVALIVRMKKEYPGYSHREIGKFFGRSASTIAAILKSQGIQSVDMKAIRDRNIQRIDQYIKEHDGCSRQEIADALGLSIRTVFRLTKSEVVED